MAHLLDGSDSELAAEYISESHSFEWHCGSPGLLVGNSFVDQKYLHKEESFRMIGK